MLHPPSVFSTHHLSLFREFNRAEQGYLLLLINSIDPTEAAGFSSRCRIQGSSTAGGHHH